MIYLLILTGLFDAISEASNHGKINFLGSWFRQDSWQNKNQLFERLHSMFPKPVAYILAYWVLIYFTDAFHFFKGLLIVTIGISIQYSTIQWYWYFIIYSGSFTVFYTSIDLINQWTKSKSLQ